MKSIQRAIILLILILTGCGADYFEVEIGEPEKVDLPQTTSVVDVPYSYFLVQTKFQPGQVIQDFRYRATINGVEYSYAENPGSQFRDLYGQNSFQVVVPENDSHQARTVRIETALKDLSGKKGWEEWRTVFEGEQSALPESEPLALEGIASRGVRLLTGNGTAMDLDIETNTSGIALRAILLRGDVILTMAVANNLMDTNDREAIEVFRRGIPLYQVPYHSVRKGDIYMDDTGRITFENQTLSHGVNGRATFLGTVSQSSLESFSEICDYCQNYDGRNMTLTLAK